MNHIAYKEIYDAFVSAYHKGVVGPEDVGFKIVEMGREALSLNLAKLELKRSARKKAAECFRGIDPDTGKPVAAGKAEVMADATDEVLAYEELEAHSKACADAIYALKDLKEGIALELKNA